MKIHTPIGTYKMRIYDQAVYGKMNYITQMKVCIS